MNPGLSASFTDALPTELSISEICSALAQLAYFLPSEKMKFFFLNFLLLFPSFSTIFPPFPLIFHCFPPFSLIFYAFSFFGYICGKTHKIEKSNLFISFSLFLVLKFFPCSSKIFQNGSLGTKNGPSDPLKFLVSLEISKLGPLAHF